VHSPMQEAENARSSQINELKEGTCLTKRFCCGNHLHLGVDPGFTIGRNEKFGKRKSGFLKLWWPTGQPSLVGR
jgi:hypothetical protein